MFAIDIKVSPLLPLSLFVCYGTALLLIFEGSGLSKLACLAALLLSLHMLHLFKSLYSDRIRRVVFTATRSVLIYESSINPHRHAAPPAVVRSGEFLVILRFCPQVEGASGAFGARNVATLLRLWPGSLSRAQASRLRSYLRFHCTDS